MKKNKKLISIFKNSPVDKKKSIDYITKTSAINYVKYSTQQVVSGNHPGSIPGIEDLSSGNFISSENLEIISTENNYNLVIE